MAPGHMIPMIDIAKLLAQRGVLVTIVTTPINAQRFSNSINRAIESGLKIQLLKIRFPSLEAGLPEGCENLDMLPSLNMATNFFVALNLFKQEVEESLKDVKPKPSCLISDMGLPWTTKIAKRFHIPLFVFHGTCCFSLLCSYNILISKIRDDISSDTEYFEVPGLPDRIEVTKAQTSITTNVNSSALKDVADQIREVDETSYGVVVNSFEELELEYVKEYRKAKGEKKVWCVGPVSLCNRENSDKAERGNTFSIDQQYCLNWLDSCKPRSVIYASFGSLSRLPPLQMMELAFGLEASERPFIWSIGGGGQLDVLEKLISENGFEERIKGRGVLIRGWAPQVLILSHQAIGGFLTHCGWNSILEGISAGLPMVAWPQFAEQFYNEKLIVKVLKIGVTVGVEVPVKWGEEEKAGILVKRDAVKKALDELMDEGKAGQERRRRAGELGEKANKAIEEGGSSHQNLTLLIQDIRDSKVRNM
ncbi:hypothetical protein ACH5RR_004673 [Cinchona calisaya]|uniref:Glycosyltransferase n=1 Tax=Cinchona calisaya TaxID=153742 RepID=A0ABD3AY78_9GENT